MSEKIDGVLEKVGAFGLYQLCQQALFSLTSIISAMHFALIVFHSITPDFRCMLPGWDNDTYQIQSDQHNESVNHWIPRDEEGNMDQCKIYSGAGEENSSVVECSQHVFSNDVYWGNMINMQFGMVCSNIGVGTAVKTVFTAGLCVGAPLVGALADRFGRKKTLIGCMFVGGIAGTVASFSTHIAMFAALRFITAMCYVGSALLIHIGLLEATGPSGRGLAVLVKTPFWPIGSGLTSLVAYYIQDWNWLQLAISIPSIVLALIMILFLEETPHYLVTKGHHDQAVQLFCKIARMNRKTVPKDLLEKLKEDEEEAKKEKLVSILKAPVLIKRTLVFFYLWFVAGIGYYGLNFNAGNLTGSVFLNNVLLSVAELPAGLVGFASAATGRKPPTLLSLFLGSGSLVGAALMYVFTDVMASLYSTILLVISMFGKLCLSVLFAFDYLWSTEVYPSTLRASLMGLSSLLARIGTIPAPAIVDLHMLVDTPFKAGIGPFIFGITLLIGGFLAIYLPETNKQKLPETIHQAETFKAGSRREKSGNDIELVYSSQADLITEKL